MPASAVCSLSPPAAPAHWPSTFFLTILIFHHFSESFHSIPYVLWYCSFCLGKLIPTFLTSFSLLCPNPGHSSLEYMMHFNLFFSFTGPSSGGFSLMTPVWLRLCSSMSPISTLILALAFDLFEYKDYMLDLQLLYSDLHDVNTQEVLNKHLEWVNITASIFANNEQDGHTSIILRWKHLSFVFSIIPYFI